MPYGTIKVDNIIYTKGGVDTTLTVSGIVDSLSGAISVTGSISGASVSAPTGTFTTLSGNTTAGTTATFTSGIFTTFSGTTVNVVSGVFASGTVALPSVSVGTSGNGLYSPGTNQVGISTSGNGRLTVDSAGNVSVDGSTVYIDAANNRVGLGTASPTSLLHLVTSSSSGSSNTDGVRINSGGNVAINIGSNSTTGYGWIQSANWGAGYISTAINPNGGNVGIGTTGPSSPLHVYSVGNTELLIGGTQTPILNLIGGAGTDPVIGYGVGALRFGTTTGAGAAGFSEKMILDASGNLGLGVVPSAWAGLAYKAIEVGAVGNALFGGTNDFEISANAYYASGWKYGSANPATVYVQYNGQHQWKTSTNTPSTNGAITFTQAMTLDASGNLGIGTTAPYASLEVQGTQQTHTGVSSQVGPITAYNTTNNADTAAVRTVLSLMRAGKSGVSYGSQANFNIGRYSQANANANTQLNLRLANGVTNDPDNDVMTWLGDGRVGIGTTSPGYTLDVANSVIQVGTSTDAFVQYKSTAGNWHVGANSSNAYVFYSGTYGSGTECARIDSSGLQINGDRIRVATAKTPASATATGTAGEVCWDANYIYVCTATNTWKRAAIATW